MVKINYYIPNRVTLTIRGCDDINEFDFKSHCFREDGEKSIKLKLILEHGKEPEPTEELEWNSVYYSGYLFTLSTGMFIHHCKVAHDCITMWFEERLREYDV